MDKGNDRARFGLQKLEMVADPELILLCARLPQWCVNSCVAVPASASVQSRKVRLYLLVPLWLALWLVGSG